MRIEIKIKGDNLVVQLIQEDDQGGWIESEDSLPLADIHKALSEHFPTTSPSPHQE
jgi:hypothetical protein